MIWIYSSHTNDAWPWGYASTEREVSARNFAALDKEGYILYFENGLGEV